MTTPSMVLLCAGAAAGLSGVWALAGLSESSNVRGTPRVIAATAVGLLGLAAVHFRAPAEMRGDLGLPAQHGEQADAELARETVVDHLERRHAAAHDAHLIREIERPRLTRRRRCFSRNSAFIDAVEQRVDFVLIQYVLAAHGAITALRNW